MAISLTPNDPRALVFCNDTWVDIYRRLRQADGQTITIQVGNQDEDLGDQITPGVANFTLDNRDGVFTPMNAMSPLYPDIDINTPLCIVTDEVYDRFGRVASNTWGNSTTGETYTTQSVNGVISATDYSTDGTYGIHSIPAASAYRMTYFSTTSRAPSAYNVIQKLRFRMSISDVTGASIEPANLVCRLQSATTYYMLRVNVTTAEAITLTIMRDDTTVLAGPVTVPISYAANTDIWVKFAAIDDGLYATCWTGNGLDSEPTVLDPVDNGNDFTDWLISATDTTYGYGRYGIRSGVASGNTNTKPIQVKYSYYTVYTSEFNGEIPEWPQEYSEDSNDKVVPVEAGGLLRRFAESKVKLKSSMRRFYEVEEALFYPDQATYYWPLDEGELSSQGSPVIGASSAPFEYNFSASVDTADEKHFGQSKIAPWLPNGIVILKEGFELCEAQPQAPTGNITHDFFVFQWVRTGGSGSVDSFVLIGTIPTGLDAITIDCDAYDEEITIDPSTAAAPTVVDATTLDTNIFDGAAHLFRLVVIVTGGVPTDVSWELLIDNSSAASGTVADWPIMTQIQEIIFRTDLGGPADILAPTRDSGFAHVAFYADTDTNNAGTAYLRFTGSTGEDACTRVARLCNEHGITHFISSTNGMLMGPQFEDTLFAQFEEVTRTDGGIFRELLSVKGLHYDSLEDLRGRSVSLVLDVGNGELASDGFHPVKDSQRLANQVTAKKRSGSEYTHTRTSGRLGTADPKLGGAGAYGKDTNVNPANDQLLINIAQRETSEGTFNKFRFPIVGVDLMSNVIKNDPALRRQVLDTYVSTRFQLTNMDEHHIHDDADLLVIGHQRILGPFDHKIYWNTVPYDSLDTFHVETAGSILGTNTTYLVDDITTSDTTWDFVTDGVSLWTVNPARYPISVLCQGEEVSFADVDTIVPVFRSVGTASHGDNASTAPGLPTGHASGDTLIMVTAIRNTSATAVTPSGWFPLIDFGHLKVLVREDNGAIGAQTCTYTGGAAGDTTSSFIMAFTNCPFNYANSVPSSALTNTSAQNIAFPVVSVPRSNGLVLYIGWKQDDFTSVDTFPGHTEIIEASTTTGNDQSLVASYQLITYASDTLAGNFVVNGGASAVSKGMVLNFTGPQRATGITRSVNGVVKAHSILDPITIAHPKVLG